MAQTDEFGKHEVLDRVHIIRDMFEQFVAEHDAVQADDELNIHVMRISTLLGDLYQLCGRKFL